MSIQAIDAATNLRVGNIGDATSPVKNCEGA